MKGRQRGAGLDGERGKGGFSLTLLRGHVHMMSALRGGYPKSRREYILITCVGVMVTSGGEGGLKNLNILQTSYVHAP